MSLRNLVVATGVVKSIWEKKGIYHVKLYTRQASSYKRDVTPVFLSKEPLPEWVNIRARVEITGYIEEYSLRNASGTWIKNQRFVVTSITPWQTQCEKAFGVNGYFFDAPSISVQLQGIIKEKVKDGTWNRFLIETDAKDAKALIRVHMNERENAPEVNVGDRACCVCTVSTPEKEKDGTTTVFEDLIVSDIAKEA